MASKIVLSSSDWLMQRLPHYVLIDGHLLGLVKGKSVEINLPAGSYRLTIRSMYRFIEGSRHVEVRDGETLHLSFGDRERLWNWLFNLDLVLWIVKRIIHVPEPWGTVYEVVSNGFFALWIIRLWIIRKRYFALRPVSSVD